ncbi:hypothetical protein AB2B41_06960 [Marimonas sp. MJW-29]|uniref:Uncharacterized protein n=1 Tax=Sulfitobacter sediminis TaxID=3234186 RepID=A0ABV3RKX1_9RHOB
MRYRLDETRHVGALRIAALVEQDVTPSRFASAAFITGRKRPVALLFARGEVCWAMTPEGAALEKSTVETLMPGAWERFRRNG